MPLTSTHAPSVARLILMAGWLAHGLWAHAQSTPSTGSPAGHWSQQMRDPAISLDSIEAAFQAAWDTAGIPRGKGHKPFERWLAFARPRTDAQGHRIANGQVLRSLARAEADRTQEAQQRSIHEPTWEVAGPTGPTGLGGSGRLNRLVPRPGHPLEWWACAPAGGLWRTQDGGEHWTAMGNGQLTSIGVTDVAFHPTDSATLWMATGDGDFGDTRSIGVWTSADGGESWVPTGLQWAPFMGRTLTRILVHPTHPDTLWTASSLGVYCSVDGGNQWARTLTGDIASLELDPSDPDHLLAGAFGNTVAESHDAGQTWTTQSLDGQSYGLSRIAMAFAPSAPDTVYALAGRISDQGFGGLWQSADGGASWTQKAHPDDVPNLLGWTVGGTDDGGQAWYDLTIAVHPDAADHVMVGGVNLWRSLDGGSEWNCAAHWYAGGDLPYAHADQHGIVFLDDGALLLANDGGAFLMNADGTEITDHSAGLGIAQAYRADADPLAMDRFMAGTQDNGTFLKHDGQWEHILGGDGFNCAFHDELQDVMYASLYYGQLFRSDDGGNAFKPIADNAGSGVNGQGAWLTPWATSPFNPDWILMAKDKVYRSTDRGEMWTALGDMPGGKATALALAPSDAARIYVAKEHRLFRSTDGQTFEELDLPNGFSWIQDVMVAQDDADHLWVALANYQETNKVLTSDDGGLTWTDISDGLPPAPINCLVATAPDGGDLFAGTDVGVYHLAHAPGSPWERQSQGLPNVVVSDLDLHAPSGRLVASTYGRGLYTLTLPDPPALDAALGRILSPQGAHCDPMVNAVVPVLNLGTETVHQMRLQFGHFGGESLDTLWNGELLPGDSLHLSLQPVSAPAGWSDFTVLLTEVNGAPDERTANNSRSNRTRRETEGTEVIVSFTTDCFASQHGWVIRDPLGRVLYRSGWLSPRSTSTDTLCLPDACLEFEVHRDELSGYESLMEDCLSPLEFDVRRVGDPEPVLQSPSAGVVGVYTLCLDDTVGEGGCTDPYATNYSDQADFEDGTCEPTCYPLTIAMDAGCDPEDNGWTLSPDGLSVVPGSIQSGAQSWTLCLDAGCRTFQLQDFGGDGWSTECGADAFLRLATPYDTLYEGTPDFIGSFTWDVCLPPVTVEGCRLPQACNFNPDADGDGDCDFSCYGCTDPNACNLDAGATRDDGSCVFASGCTHPAACNFDLFALCDDGSCEFAPLGLDCAGQCLSGDADGDGVCDGDEFEGCTHPEACNYAPGSTEDDGSCIFPTLAWPDVDDDGFGQDAPGSSASFCGVLPPGWVTVTGDCNDASATVYPGAPMAPLGEDVNCDGFVSGSELAPCASDITGDGLTAIEDLLGLLSEFGCTVDCEQDVDGNGAVTSSDLLILLAGFGTVCAE